MKVYVYPADDQGCGLHRIIWPALTLKGRGYNIRIVMPHQRAKFLEGKLNAAGKMVDAVIPEDADVIVLQRVSHRHLTDAISLIRAKGVAVVVDMDDDLAAIDPRNPAFGALHPRSGNHPDHSWAFTQRACEAATLVTTSTPELIKRYAPHGRGEVLYNCIPERYLRMTHEDSDKIGWAGSVHSHPDDLQATGTALCQVTNSERPFHVVGPPEGARAALRLNHDPVGTGPLDPTVGWPNGVITLGIGVAPLADTRFNRSKSWLKPLEYAALGVPCVMSPSLEYTRIHELGVGMLARKPKEWIRHLRNLQNDPELRQTLTQRGRAVAANWTVEGNAECWWHAWEQAYKLEQNGLKIGA